LLEKEETNLTKILIFLNQLEDLNGAGILLSYLIKQLELECDSKYAAVVVAFFWFI